MTLSSKLLFIMLKINDLFKKLVFDLYLVNIYVSTFVYMCTYVYDEYARIWLRIYILTFFLLFGIENGFVILFIYHTKF